MDGIISSKNPINKACKIQGKLETLFLLALQPFTSSIIHNVDYNVLMIAKKWNTIHPNELFIELKELYIIMKSKIFKFKNNYIILLKNLRDYLQD